MGFGRVFDIVIYGLLGALLVLVVMNASNVANLITSGGGVWLKESQLLTGSGYKKAA